jgi:hypothetical protein
MDIHLSENGATTADKVHEREEFRLLVGDIHELPETQKTALVLREMDALSYEQIAEAMETTVPSVKSLLVRARISLAEAAEARLLSCDEVRIELGEVAEGLIRRPSPLVRRHLRSCKRCESFRGQLKETNKALAALLPIGPFVLLKKLALTHLGHSAGSSATAAGSGAAASGSGAAAGTGAAAAGSAISFGSGAGGVISAGLGAVATKAAAGLAAAAIVTAGAVEVDHSASNPHPSPQSASLQASAPATPLAHGVLGRHASASRHQFVNQVPPAVSKQAAAHKATKPDVTKKPATTAAPTVTTPDKTADTKTATTATPVPASPQPGRTQTETAPTVLAMAPVNTPASTASPTPTTTTTASPAPAEAPPSDGGAAPTPPTTTDPTATVPDPTTTVTDPTTTTTDIPPTDPGSGPENGSGSAPTDPGASAVPAPVDPQPVDGGPVLSGQQ